MKTFPSIKNLQNFSKWTFYVQKLSRNKMWRNTLIPVHILLSWMIFFSEGPERHKENNPSCTVIESFWLQTLDQNWTRGSPLFSWEVICKATRKALFRPSKRESESEKDQRTSGEDQRKDDNHQRKFSRSLSLLLCVN